MTRRTLVAFAAVAALAACSSHPPTRATTGPDRANHGGDPAAVPDAGAPAPSPGAGALTRAECDALIAHVLEVGLAEMRASRPADEVPTEEQIAQAKQTLSAEMMDQCLAWDRAAYACVMDATTSAALGDCAATPAPRDGAR